MYRQKLIKIGKRILQIGVPLVVLVFIVYTVSGEWHQLTSQQFQLHPWFLALAFLGFLLQELSYGLIWRTVLRRLGYTLDLRACLRIYLASEFVRYIPGNVWHVLTRIMWAGKYGVPRPVAFASMTIELITKLAAGAVVFALSLLFWGDVGAVSRLVDGTPFVIALGIILLSALLIVLHPRVLNGLLNVALRILKRTPVVLTLRYRDILLVTLYWSTSWLIAGVAFFFLLLALWPAAPIAVLPICIGIYAFVWDIGFLSFITPSGLGVREGAVILLFGLAFPLPFGLAGIVAILSRLVSTAAELLCVGLAYVSGGKQVRAIQQEEVGMMAVSVPADVSDVDTYAAESGIEPIDVASESGAVRD